jgi:DUF1365 family protein
VHINAAILFSCVFHKLNRVVEHTLDALTYVIFEMIVQIDNTLVLEVRFTIISGTVYNMGDACFLEGFLVTSHVVTS